MTRLWWVRHGPTHANSMIGWTDAPADLSDTARLERLRRFLPQAPVISSDLSRAVATADALHRPSPRLPHDRSLREIHFGEWEAKTFTEIERSHGPLIRHFWESPGEVRAPAGESWDDLRTRVDAAADRLVARGGDVIVVAHMGAILTQVQRASGQSAYATLAQKIDNLSVTKLTYDGTWQMDLVNHCP